MRLHRPVMTSEDPDTSLRTTTEQAVAFLDAGIAENKAQLTKRFEELVRLLGSEEPPSQEGWKLARASIALTLGLLAREDEKVARMLRDRDDEMEDWLLDTLRPKKRARSSQRSTRRRAKSNR